MTSTLAHAPAPASTRPTTARRVGHGLSIAINAVMLWAVHRLLDWGWPGFLTEDFGRVLPILSLSLVAGMLASGCFLVRDRGRVRALVDIVTGAIGIQVVLTLWRVFPFDFAGYGQDWSTIVRVLLVLGAVGTGIGIVVSIVRLVRPDDPALPDS